MKGAPASTGRWLRIVRNRNFWLIVAMLAICALLHYGSHIQFIALISERFPPGLTRHAMDRILFLLPIAYAGFVFGPLKGFVTLLVAAAIMFPRAILISPAPADAILETVAVLVTGGLVILWFESLEKEKALRAQVIAKLEVAQQELQSHVQVIEQDRKQLTTLSNISAIVSQSLELELVLNGALDRIMELMQVDVALIFLLDEEAQELVLAAHRGVSREFTEGVARLKLGEGFNGRVAQSGEPMVVPDASRDPQLTRMVVRQEKLQSTLIVPLKSKGKVMGTLCVHMRRPRQFLPEEIELFSHIANHIGVAVENARLYKQAQLIAEQLRMSEKNYRELFENAQDAIWVHDLDGNIVAANKVTSKVTGYSQQELIGMNVRDYLSPEGLNTAREIRHRLLQGEILAEPYEQQLVKKDGTTRIMRLASSMVTRDGQVTGFQHVARDVTEQKQMQDNLRFYVQQITRAQEEERLRIARELHDDTTQELVTLSRQLDTFSDGSEQLPEQAIKRLDELQNRIDGIIKSVRRFSQDLRPSVLDDLGLVAALEFIADDMRERYGIATEVQVAGKQQRLPPEKELLLFRIVQEALRNVWRHSQASAAFISVDFGHDKIKITVQDNGQGFQLPKRLGDLASAGKLGLAGMYERTQLLGGSLELQSTPGKGTTLIIEVPVSS